MTRDFMRWDSLFQDQRETLDAAYQKYVTADAGATFPASPM